MSLHLSRLRDCLQSTLQTDRRYKRCWDNHVTDAWRDAILRRGVIRREEFWFLSTPTSPISTTRSLGDLESTQRTDGYVHRTTGRPWDQTTTRVWSAAMLQSTSGWQQLVDCATLQLRALRMNWIQGLFIQIFGRCASSLHSRLRGQLR